jgi:hypothetical protein
MKAISLIFLALVSLSALAAQSVASIGETVLAIRSDAKIFQRTLKSDWSLFPQQLPAGVKPVAIVGVDSKSDAQWDGFNAGEKVDGSFFLIIAEDGSNYIGNVNAGTITVSRAKIPTN